MERRLGYSQRLIKFAYDLPYRLGLPYLIGDRFSLQADYVSPHANRTLVKLTILPTILTL